MNKRNGILAASIFVVAAGVAIYLLVQNDRSLTTNTNNTTHNPSDDTTRNKSEVYKKYDALKGEVYDKAFLANMIVHHESAMNMAEMAGAGAKRQEIKDLAMDIATSQGKEVSEMTTWQQRWDYPATSGHSMTDSENAGSSMEGMVTMNDELKDLSGDAFDKKFLELMIVHHQGAIDMSEPAATNAYHHEVKELARAIVSAQTSEIAKMQQWQADWGYAVTDSEDAPSMPATHH